jgi:hypothetical protein
LEKESKTLWSILENQTNSNIAAEYGISTNTQKRENKKTITPRYKNSAIILRGR